MTTLPIYSATLQKTRRVCTLFFRSDKAVSVIEFAFIAPLLVSIYLGTVEGFLVIRAEQEAASSSAVLVSSITRQMSAGTTELNSAFAAARLQFIKNNPDNAEFTLTNLRYVNSTTGEGIWQVNSDVNHWDGADGFRFDNSSAATELAFFNSRPQFTVPSGSFDANGEIDNPSTLLVAEVRLQFENPIGFVFSDSVSVVQRTYFTPRREVTGALAAGTSDVGIPRMFPDCAKIDASGVYYSTYAPSGQSNVQQTTFTSANHGC